MQRACDASRGSVLARRPPVLRSLCAQVPWRPQRQQSQPQLQSGRFASIVASPALVRSASSVSTATIETARGLDTDVGGVVHAGYARLLSAGQLEEDGAQIKVVEFMAAALRKACAVAAKRQHAVVSGRDAWVYPTQTLGVSGIAAGDAERIAAYTAKLAAENRQRVRKQKAEGRPQAVGDAPGTNGALIADVDASNTPALRGGSNSELLASDATGAASPRRRERRSIYLHGSVGTGKTMLLNLFYGASQDVGLRTRRQHFYEFMVNLHQEIHATQEARPVEVVANSIADNVDAMCFDEFQITDIQDASILPRIFEVLFDRGVVVVMTSNTAPQLLYSGGLNRHVYIPAFANLLGDHCTVLGLGGRRAVDYRRKAEAEEFVDAISSSSSSSSSPTDLYLAGPDSSDLLMKRWKERLASGGVDSGEARVLPLPMGRSLRIDAAVGRVCWVTFDELCGSDRGETDFLALASEFRTIFLSGVPKFVVLEDVDLVRRFVKLLDVLYDRRVQLVVAAAAPPAELFDKMRFEVSSSDMGDLAWRTAMYSADGRKGMAPSAVGTLCEAVRATERAESRLREMRTRRYWNSCSDATAS